MHLPVTRQEGHKYIFNFVWIMATVLVTLCIGMHRVYMVSTWATAQYNCEVTQTRTNRHITGNYTISQLNFLGNIYQ